MLLVDWKNTGSTIVRGVIASIDIFDSAGNRLACSSSRQWVYADSKGISPGGNYREPAGEGFNIIPSPTESSQPARWKVTILEALEKEQ
jgi:hypothetical protein